MKTKQMALTLMFFACFALLFTECKSVSYTRTSSLEIKPPRRHKKPAPADTQPAPVVADPVIIKETVIVKETVKEPATTETIQHQITVSVDPRSTPLTWDLVRNIQNSGLSLRDLDYSLSKSFAMTILERKDAPQKLEISEGVLKAPQAQNITSVRIMFTPEHKGALSTDMDVSPETFVIVFTPDEEEIPLTFKRNSQGRYDLASAMIDAERRTVFTIEDDPPQLCILTELNKHLETLAIFNSNQAVSRSWQSYEAPSYKAIPAGGSSRQFDQSTRQFSPSRKIDDTRNSVNKTGITNYVKDRNHNVDSVTLSKLIDTYISEAEIEGINLDIAIAQMLHATNYLRNRMTTRNYAGLSTNGVRWDGSFPDMRTGVKAHIQHLKGYVSTHRPVPCVDPRYDMLAESGYWGQVKTFDQLFGAWSQNSAYGNEINRILNGLYQSSGVR
jgi:hypothetical protein